LRLGLRDAQQCLRLPLCLEHRRLSLAVGLGNLGLLLSLRHEHRRRLLAFRLENRRPPIPLRPHLLLHGILHVGRRGDVLELDPIHFDPPFVRRLVQDGPQLRIDRVAGREGVIEIELADHVAKRRLRQLLERVRQVGDFVDGPDGIGDLEVDERVDGHRDVVARDHVLLREIVDRLPEVDALDMSQEVNLALAGDVDLHEALLDGANLVDERPDDVHAAVKSAVLSAQALDDDRFCLLHDLDTSDRHHDDDDCQDGEDREPHDRPPQLFVPTATLRRLPVMATTRTMVPTGMASAPSENAAHSSPPHVHLPTERGDLCRHPRLPIEAGMHVGPDRTSGRMGIALEEGRDGDEAHGGGDAEHRELDLQALADQADAGRHQARDREAENHEAGRQRELGEREEPSRKQPDEPRRHIVRSGNLHGSRGSFSLLTPRPPRARALQYARF
jgi:hypothetical protein